MSFQENKNKNKFSIQIKDKNGSKVIASTSGDAPYQIRDYKSVEMVGVYPYFEINLLGNDVDKIIDLDDCIIIFKSSDISYEVKSCIINKKIILADGSVYLTGKFAKKELCLDTNTKYLGGDTKSAIQALGFEQKIVSKNNVAVNYYLVNETPINRLLHICDSESDFPYWTIGINEIVLTKNDKLISFFNMSTIDNLIVATMPTKNESEANVDDVYYLHNNLNFTLLGNKENYESVPRIVKNSLYNHKYKPYIVITGSFNSIFPYKLGDVFNNGLKSFKTVKFWMVSSVVRNYNIKGEVSTGLQYITWNEE